MRARASASRSGRTPSASAGTGSTLSPARGRRPARRGRSATRRAGRRRDGQRPKRRAQRGLAAGADHHVVGAQAAAGLGGEPGPQLGDALDRARAPTLPAAARRGPSRPQRGRRLQLRIQVAASQRDRARAREGEQDVEPAGVDAAAGAERDRLPGEVGRAGGGGRALRDERPDARGAARRRLRRPGGEIARCTVIGEARWRAISSRTDGSRSPGGRPLAPPRANVVDNALLCVIVRSCTDRITLPPRRR